jgi:hypothetical protein
MVRKNDLLRYVSEQARLEAKKRNLDEYAAEDLVSEARDIVDDIFMSITWEKVEGDVIKSIDPVNSWRHRGASDMESDWRYMHFSRADLQNAAERYIQRPWLHCRELDWLIVDSLTYAECQATVDFFRSRIMPLSRYISKKAGSIKWQISSGLWRSIVFLVKWLLWLCLLAVTSQFAPVAAVVWIGITVLWQWRKWSAQKKLDDLMAVMIDTYATLSTVSQTWQVVWDELKKSRDAGAVWDGIVYRLVEERMRS